MGSGCCCLSASRRCISPAARLASGVGRCPLSTGKKPCPATRTACRRRQYRREGSAANSRAASYPRLARAARQAFPTGGLELAGRVVAGVADDAALVENGLDGLCVRRSPAGGATGGRSGSGRPSRTGRRTAGWRSCCRRRPGRRRRPKTRCDACGQPTKAAVGALYLPASRGRRFARLADPAPTRSPCASHRSPPSPSPPPAHAAPVADLATLKAGDRHHRFETTAVYLDAADRPMGARFLHRRTGFTLDLLQIESVPQAFTWVNTFATSDQGEPHTQEHLLLLRGMRGRTLGGQGSMSLVDELGLHRELAHQLLLQHRRRRGRLLRRLRRAAAARCCTPTTATPRSASRCATSASPRAPTARLRLEEKGTVYNEMVASMANGGLAGLAGAEPRRLRHAAPARRTTRAASPRASGR